MYSGDGGLRYSGLGRVEFVPSHGRTEWPRDISMVGDKKDRGDRYMVSTSGPSFPYV